MSALRFSCGCACVIAPRPARRRPGKVVWISQCDDPIEEIATACYLAQWGHVYRAEPGEVDPPRAERLCPGCSKPLPLDAHLSKKFHPACLARRKRQQAHDAYLKKKVAHRAAAT